MRPGGLFAAIVGVCVATSARAGETDYLPDNAAWNGLSELADLARGMQLQIEQLEELNWRGMPQRGTLLVVYPTVALDPIDVMVFVGRGGKLLIADDHGAAAPLYAKFGVRRRDASELRAARHHDGNPHLPVAVATGARHGLTTGLGEVVANHPAWFGSRYPTLLGFDGEARQQLLVAARIGHGELVALADPSTLINGMLRFEGNMTLATNLLRHLAPREGQSLYLVTGHFRVQGRPAASAPEAARAGAVQRFMTEYNTFLSQLNFWAAKPATLRSLAFVCGSLAVVGLLLFLPLPRRELDGAWLRPHAATAGGFEEQVRRSGAPRAIGGGLAAAAVLREEVEEILGELLQAPGPIATIQASWVVTDVRQRAGEHAAQLCSQLLAALRQVPQGEAPGLVGGRIGRRDLARVYELSRELLTRLDGPRLRAITSRPEDGARSGATKDSERER